MVERYSYRRESDNHPSFSSTLLDAIYRSIDEGKDGMVIFRDDGMRKKPSFCSGGGDNVRGGVFKSDEEMANLRRACMIEKWMEKKASEKAVGRRKSVADLQVKKPRKERESSSWSSSDSSCGGGGGGGGFFSSSETESFPVQRPKPIRTGLEKEKHGGDRRELEQKPKNDGGFSKTKLRALKIYGDLKKVKQPISPGGKLAGFLNSLFTGGNLKKHKIAGDDSPSLKSTNASTCSSASSFSRSCLSKTPSSKGKPAAAAAAKRSVRFSPVSVIVDEDCQPCGHKSLHTEINNYNYDHGKKQTSNLDAAKIHDNVSIIKNVINDELMAHVMEKNRRVEEVARDLLRNYQRKNQVGYEQELKFDHLRKSHVKNQVFDQDFSFDHLRKSHVKNQVFDQDFDDDDDDDDAASYASSDLFELDNLSAIGMERYREELPVYETTHVTNGLIF